MYQGRVLVVDDEPLVVRRVVAALEAGGFYVEFATDGFRALEMLRAGDAAEFDCVVLDVNMPLKNGFEVLRELRLCGNQTPVLMLTELSGENEAVMGFSVGADDYMTKPLRRRELVARVQRLVRSTGRKEAPITVQQTVFDLSGFNLSGPDGSAELSFTESRLLRPLLQPPGRLVPKSELLVAGWGSSDSRNVRNLYEHIRRIRVLFRTVGSDLSIRSVRKAGYRIENSE